ncbi:glycosyltransferase [Carboxydothermus hydrogenoformans]|uniref:Glycosyl transferase, group 1 family protein n=1 Tax=Carboxydothermus hydrogenoformans (strain ATCC BAA-161 / DSM 6008 / Z-2901) TaxID=246194 RepID=Q3AD84_CARHZ|nr:glycosyltransferase [Carboxydothermus hydrogenoformans]ABB13961.1 glycosyl transferase, group 1 family protein [Carboxydothermus hydrogenoformans Z-2901]
MQKKMLIPISSPWEKHHRKQLILNLADEFKNFVDIYVIDRPYDILTYFLRKTVTKNYYRNTPGLNKVKENLYVLGISQVFHEHISSLNVMFDYINKNYVKTEIKKFISDVDIIWISEPNHRFYFDIFYNSIKIYEIYDEYLLRPNGKLRNAKIVSNDQQICDEADIIFYTSPKILQRRQKYSEKMFFINNGVDYSLFNANNENENKVILKIDNKKRNIIFVGNIGEFIEINAFFEILNEDNNHLYIIGNYELPMKNYILKLKSYNNCTYLGYIDHNKLKYYLQKMDIGVIPFKENNEFVEAINPLKFYEYLACGLPVVSLDLPIYNNLPEGLVYRYKKFSEINDLIKIAFDEKAKYIDFRKKYAQKNDWKNIAKAILSIFREKGII